MAAAVPIRERWSRLFGLDIGAALDFWRRGWAEALRWPALAWLTPPDPIRVLAPDGSESTRIGVGELRLAASPATPFVAIELPEDDVLRRKLVLPPLPDREIAQAVELDVRAATPFADGDTVWACRIDRDRPGGIQVDVVLTSRLLVERRLEANAERLRGRAPEVWAPGAPPSMLPGFGETGRLARARRQRAALLSLLALAGVLVLAIAIVPTWALHRAAVEAQRAGDELARRAEPQVRKREQLGRLSVQLRALDAAARERPDVLGLLNELTRQLPDDVMLTRLEITGNRVRLIGQGENAAQLLQALGALPGFHDVRAPQGIARSSSGGKDSFTIDFSADARSRP